METTDFKIENEYVRILELTRRANLMSQNITTEDVEFKPVLRIPKPYLAHLHEKKDSSEKEHIIGVVQRSIRSESETVMTVAEFETKLEAIERMSTSSGDVENVDASINSVGDPFFNMQQHMLIGVASMPLSCIKSSANVVEWDLPIVSPSGLMSGSLAVSLQLLYVNNDGRQNSVMSDDGSSVDIKLGSQICLKVDVSHVKDLPAFYGNFLFGQYDLFGQSQPTVFYSEDHSTRPPCDDECEISVEFNHCQVHPVDVTEEVYNIINHGYAVVELWGHQGAVFDQAKDDDDKHHNSNHVQLWVQILEKTNEEVVDYQPALVEEDQFTSTGGIFVLSKTKKKRLRVQVVSPSRRVRCHSVSLLGVTELSKEPVTTNQWGVQPYQNIISSAWAQSFDRFEDKKTMRRKISQPQFGPSSIVEQNMKQKASNMGISRTPDPEKKSKLQKRHSSNQIQQGTQVPFLERETSYPEGSTFRIDDDISQTLRPLKCKRNNEAIAEWENATDIQGSCADNWYRDVIVKTTLQTGHYKTMEFILRKRICIKIVDDQQIDNYTSFITGYGGRKIGTKCGALFDISPKDTMHTTIDRRDSMAYIEVFKGENPDAVLMGRLQYISQLHKQRKQSGVYLENGLPEPDLDNQEDEEKLRKYTSSQRKLSRQVRIEDDTIKEDVDEQDEQNVDCTGDQCVVDETKEIGSIDLNSNTNNSNNVMKLVVGERVIIQRKGRYVFGRVRFIGNVTFSDEEQVGIELDQPYGKLNGTVNGVSYFKCKPEYGIFTTRDKIITNPLKL